MRSWLVLLPLLCAACAAPSKPQEPSRKVYMIEFGGTARAYLLNSNIPANEVIPVSKLVGGMCFQPDEWQAHELYIHELEER